MYDLFTTKNDLFYRNFHKLNIPPKKYITDLNNFIQNMFNKNNKYDIYYISKYDYFKKELYFVIIVIIFKKILSIYSLQITMI